MYPITKNYLSGLPQQPYKDGVGKYNGICLHATASWEDSDTGERDYEQGSWKNAFVHYFVDHDSITQAAPTEYKAWGAGPQANSRFVHIELCQSRDPKRFQEAYNRWVWLAAYLLYQRKLGVSQAKSDGSGTLWSHKDVTEILGGTTHQDPIDYLASHGKTWDNVMNDVTYLYQQMDKSIPKELPKVDGFCKVQSEGITVEGVIIRGVSYAPVRDVAEFLGKHVAWDPKTNTAELK